MPGHEDVFLKIDGNGIAPAPELKDAILTEAQRLRDEASALRRTAVKVVDDSKWSDAPGAEQEAKFEASGYERDAAKLEAQAAELEGGAK